MGLRCTACEVIANTTQEGVQVRFVLSNEIHIGTVNITADLCANNLQTSTLTFTFTDTDGHPERSFTFVATDITMVVCRPTATGGCEVSFEGMGMVTGEAGQFSFAGSFTVEGSTNAVITTFVISGFAFIADVGGAEFPPGSVTVIGCGLTV
jgi:hypothetical protein